MTTTLVIPGIEGSNGASMPSSERSTNTTSSPAWLAM